MSKMSDADAHLHRYQGAQKRFDKWMRVTLISSGTLVGALTLVFLFTFMASVGQLNKVAYESLVFVLSMVSAASLVCCIFAAGVTLVSLGRVIKLRSQQLNAQE